MSHSVWSRRAEQQRESGWSLPDYYCFIESDVFFVPENFKRYLRLKNFTDSSVPRMVGHVWTHALFREGLLTEPSQGTCYSK